MSVHVIPSLSVSFFNDYILWAFCLLIDSDSQERGREREDCMQQDSVAFMHTQMHILLLLLVDLKMKVPLQLLSNSTEGYIGPSPIFLSSFEHLFLFAASPETRLTIVGSFT